MRKTRLQRAIDFLDDETVIIPDGFDEAFVAFGIQFNRTVSVYDYDKCIAILVKQGMSLDEAMEYFDYNVSGAWVGEGMPVFMTRIPT